MTNQNRWLELSELYALGALDGQELVEFKDHLKAGAPDCEKRIREIEQTLAAFAQAAPELKPPKYIKKQLMHLVQPLTLRTAMPSIIGVAIVSLLLIVLYALPEKDDFVYMGMPHEGVMRPILTSEELTTVELRSTANKIDLIGSLYWDPKLCGGCFYIENLDALSANKTYQLWAIAEGHKPVSMGIFVPNEKGQAHIDIKGLPEIRPYNSFAITIEAQGGAPQPLGPMTFSGTF